MAEWSSLMGNSGLLMLVGSENDGTQRSTRSLSGAIGSFFNLPSFGCGIIAEQPDSSSQLSSPASSVSSTSLASSPSLSSASQVAALLGPPADANGDVAAKAAAARAMTATSPITG